MASRSSRQSSASRSRSSAALSGTGGGGWRPHDRGHPPPPSSSADAYRRQASSYSARSSEVSRSGSFRAAALRVAGVFGSCFVPRVQVKTQDEKDESSVAEYYISTDSGSWQEGRALSVDDICKATLNFSEKNIIKRGRSSTLYKGKLKDGSLIAVKCVRKQLNAEYLTDELRRELVILQKIEHMNLVRFLGLFERKDDCLVVVEYVGNGSLREHLDESRGSGLELAQRLNIAIDIAHAITYLHENKGVLTSAPPACLAAVPCDPDAHRRFARQYDPSTSRTRRTTRHWQQRPRVWWPGTASDPIAPPPEHGQRRRRFDFNGSVETVIQSSSSILSD